jgi:hypothetical protein
VTITQLSGTPLLEQTRLAEHVFGAQAAPRAHAELDQEQTP